jgi:hypothetical protein
MARSPEPISKTAIAPTIGSQISVLNNGKFII